MDAKTTSAEKSAPETNKVVPVRGITEEERKLFEEQCRVTLSGHTGDIVPRGI